MGVALAIFRLWLISATIEKPQETTPDGGASVYRQIAAGGDSFLGSAQVAEVYKLFNMDKKQRKDFKQNLGFIKKRVKRGVAQLLVNHTHFPAELLGSDKLPYLTCCRVDDIDIPWDSIYEREMARADFTHLFTNMDPGTYEHVQSPTTGQDEGFNIKSNSGRQRSPSPMDLDQSLCGFSDTRRDEMYHYIAELAKVVIKS
jgi:hypothetical protein